MQQVSVASVLAALMCGAAVAGHPYTPGTEPYRDVNVSYGIWCPVGIPPCANNKNVRAGSLECAYPNETTFHKARAKALAEPEARLQLALNHFALWQAIGARKERSRIEATFDREYLVLRAFWARAGVPAPSPTR